MRILLGDRTLSAYASAGPGPLVGLQVRIAMDAHAIRNLAVADTN
jgi:hypothetical protein